MAEQQMDFQERMRDTQYQSAVKDLRAAGLNPMLAALNGGNAAMSGAMAQQSNVAEGLGELANSARQTYQEGKLMKSTISKNEAETENLGEQNKNIQENNELIRQQVEESKERQNNFVVNSARTAQETQNMMTRLPFEIQEIISRTGMNNSSSAMSMKQVEKAIEEIDALKKRGGTGGGIISDKYVILKNIAEHLEQRTKHTFSHIKD